MKHLSKQITASILFIALCIGALPALAQVTVPPIPAAAQREKERLLAEYEAALDYELKHGDTATNFEDGTKILMGKSASKMGLLWQETARQIEAAIARPAADRVPIENMIAAIDGNSAIYISRSVFPYNSSVATERYQTEKYFYTVGIASSQILEIMPIDPTSFRREPNSKEPIYSRDDLEEAARTIIKNVSDTDLRALRSAFSDKNGHSYFFRWEDPTSKLPDGVRPFIQVSLSARGELLNYVNTLPASTKWEQSLLQQMGVLPTVVSASFNELYANDGGFWSWLNNGSSATTKNNAGYCYIVGWCSPTNFFWSYTDATTSPENEPYIRGMWDVNPSSQYIYLRAFIPSTNATAYSRYTATYDNGTHSESITIDQEIYSNVWAPVLGPHFNYGVVRLDNDDDIAGYKVAWDEILLCTSDQCP